jgi:NAD+ synthase
MHKTQKNGFVVGISGGVDSAVTSTLCAQTGLSVLCIEMPIHQHADHVSRAKEHIEQKNRFLMGSVEANLTTVLRHSKQQYHQIFRKQTKFNACKYRARLRMTTFVLLCWRKWLISG